MIDVPPDLGRPAEHDARLDRHVLADRDGGLDPGGCRVDDRHAGAHVAFVDADAHLDLGVGELDAVVDAEQRPVVVDLEAGDRPVVGSREAHELGQVELPGRGRRHEVPDARAEPGEVERVDPGVDLVAGELLRRRVTSLDDAAHAAALVAHDPPKTARLVHADRDERERGLGLPARSDEVGHERGIEERHVAGEHDELGGRVRHRSEGGADRISGAARLLLERERGCGRERVAHGSGHRRHDDDRWALGERMGDIDDVGQHRASADRVQHLGDARSHPGPEPGGEHGDREGPVGLAAHGVAGPPCADGGCSGIGWPHPRPVPSVVKPRRVPRCPRVAPRSPRSRPSHRAEGRPPGTSNARAAWRRRSARRPR